MPSEERPREKGFKYGVKSLSNRDLLALIINTGTAGRSVLELADELIQKAQMISRLPMLDLSELMQVKGIQKTKALSLAACFELSVRMAEEECLHTNVVESSSQLIRWLTAKLKGLHQENFLVLYLNVRNHILAERTLFVGTVDSSIVHPREVFRHALELSASRIIAVHNHPSGDAEPSQADIQITHRLKEIGDLMGIQLLDHLIIASNSWYSFRASEQW